MVKLGDARLGKSEKEMLKSIMKDRLPPEVLSRAKKGFSYPFNKWLFESGDPEIVFELNKQTQFFHKKYLQFLFDHAENGSFKHQFWSIYFFSKWYMSRFA
jgi:asparagine synthetase B (glutamine-hydrolysing)